jgi:hypothetical protein
MSDLDPFRLDRTIAAFAAQHARFRAALRAGTFAEHAFELRPPELHPDSLSALERRAGKGDPLAAPSARWLRFLLLEHACVASSGKLAHVERLRRYPMDQPEPGQFTIAELLSRTLSDAPRRGAWLNAMASVSHDVSALRFQLWDQRSEKAAELGHVAPPLRAESIETRRAVSDLLEGTQDAFDQLRLRRFEDFLAKGLGRETPGTFPARLSLRSLADLFREGSWLRSLEPQLADLPRVLGVSSVLSSLERFGAAYHDAGRNPKQPFVLSHDPEGTRRAVFGALFALLPFTRAFAAHRFEIGRTTAADYMRSLANVVLLGSRLFAVRAELCFMSFSGERAYRERLDEIVPASLGFELPRSLAGVLLVDESGLTRFAGLLAAAALHEQLTDTYDEDWFRNPRAAEALRAEIQGVSPLDLGENALQRGAELLKRRIAEAI